MSDKIPCSELKSSFSGENEKELHDNISVYVAECGKYNKMYKELHNLHGNIFDQIKRYMLMIIDLRKKFVDTFGKLINELKKKDNSDNNNKIEKLKKDLDIQKLRIEEYQQKVDRELSKINEVKHDLSNNLPNIGNQTIVQKMAKNICAFSNFMV